eukprot:2973470-Alexandrium_andersonii.AAC.1
MDRKACTPGRARVGGRRRPSCPVCCDDLVGPPDRWPGSDHGFHPACVVTAMAQGPPAQIAGAQVSVDRCSWLCGPGLWLVGCCLWGQAA